MINSIISAIGNNNSIYPLLVRDCGIEVPTKVYKTYQQNKDDKEIAYLATRERIIDEYSTSAVWLGGIPLIERVANYLIKKKKFNPEVNLKLYTEENGVQGLKYNIEKFKDIAGAEEAVKDLEKVLQNKEQYKRLQGNKFIATMAIPIALMGFVIPKAVFALTASTRAKKEALRKQREATTFNLPERNVAFSSRDVFDRFTLKRPKIISFNGGFAGAVCNLRTVDKMAITDGGYAVGRVATARKKNERIDLAFKMLGMMYLNFVAPKQIEKILGKISKQIFNVDVDLDPIILGDKELKQAILDNTLELPKSNSAKDLLEFVDNAKNSKTLFVKYASQFNKIKLLDNDVRDPRAYVDIKDLGAFRDSLYNFSESIKKLKLKTNVGEKGSVAKLIKNYILKARGAKTFNILANVGLSSYLLACVLPDLQFAFRELVTGSKLEPGLIIDDKNKKKKA